MKYTLPILAGLLCLALTPSFASAEEEKNFVGKQVKNDPCKKDFDHLCTAPEDKVNRQAGVACLNKNEGKLSAACKERRKQTTEEFKAVMKIKRKEALEKYMKGEKLDEAQREWFSGEVRENCMADLQKYCSALTDHSERFNCLKSQKKVSPKCDTFMKRIKKKT